MPLIASELNEHRMALRLELLAALAFSPVASLRGYEWWLHLLDAISPRDGRALVLHTLHGLTFEAVGERLGTTRARADQLFRRAARLLVDRRELEM